MGFGSGVTFDNNGILSRKHKHPPIVRNKYNVVDNMILRAIGSRWWLVAGGWWHENPPLRKEVCPISLSKSMPKWAVLRKTV